MKKWIKILILILVLAALSVGIYFTLRALGVTDIEGLREIIAKCGTWGWVVFILLFTTCSTLLCMIPATSATFIAVSIILFGALYGFIISTISVFLASSLMFLIGNTLGEKTIEKLVGKKSLEKAQNLLDMKSKMLLPLMFLFPVFPDDALCMVAGMTKMRYWYFAIIVAIFRTVGVATICFLGSGFINWSELSLVDWFVLINVCVFDIVLIFKYQDKLEKFILSAPPSYTVDVGNGTIVFENGKTRVIKVDGKGGYFRYKLKKIYIQSEKENVMDNEKTFITIPQKDERYYFIQSTGQIRNCLNTKENKKNAKRLDMFNFFKNQKEAERQKNCLKFTNQIRKYVEENDTEEAIEGQRYFMYFDETQGEIVIDWLQSCVIQGTIFANSKEVLLDAIKFVGEENIKKYIFGF